MSDNRESYHPTDPFSEYFRQRLKSHPVLPDAHCWNEIEARLQKKRGLFPLWIGLSIAASVFTAVFLATHFRMDKEYDGKDPSAYIEEYQEERSKAKTEDPGFSIDKTDAATVAPETVPDSRTAGKQPVAFVDRLEAEPADRDQEDHEPEMPEVAVITEGAPEQTEQKPESGEGGETGPEKPYRTFENLTAYSTATKNRPGKENGWQISAGFGSAGKFPSFVNPENDYVFADDGYGQPSPGDKGELGDHLGTGEQETPEERITGIKPSIPFSAGIMVRRKLNRTVGIETGLVYTRLSTDLEIAGKYRQDAILNLHYLGIPVNLVVDLWEKKPWNIYISGGGMVEKGLRSVYKQKDYFGSDLIRNSRISGLQWSLNGGVGLSCNFYRGMNLYIEPGVSYYFDCNQPVSKRTEDPLNFNLRLGLRYDF
ncbi:MAG: PorT family protein [Tannerella sp.]|jgi:hypothetical protein|nr:PorT family protein [Tannerella sp.]